MWRTLKRAGFYYLETQSQNQDPLENTFSVIHLHCGSNSNPNVGQFVDALKTSTIIGLVYTGLHNANCEGDDTELLDNLHSFLKESCASLLNPSTSHSRETLHDGLCGSHIAEQVPWEVNDVNMDLFSVAYVSVIARDVLRAVRCDDCKKCLTPPAMLSTNAFVYFKEYKDEEQSPTYPPEGLVQALKTSVTVLDGIAGVVHTHSVEEKITLLILDGFSLLVVCFTTKR